jgi:hypothetical protein
MSRRLRQSREQRYTLHLGLPSNTLDNYVLRSIEVDNGSLCVHLETSDSRVLSVLLTTEVARDPSLFVSYEEVTAREEGLLSPASHSVHPCCVYHDKENVCKVLGVDASHIKSISEGSSHPAYVPSGLSSSPGVNSPAAMWRVQSVSLLLLLQHRVQPVSLLLPPPHHVQPMNLPLPLLPSPEIQSVSLPSSKV